MALKLPRLQKEGEIVGDDKKPTTAFHQWWQLVVDKIEAAVNDIVAILVRLGVVEVLADDTLAFVEGTIAPDNTIKDDKVITTSVIEDGITKGAYTVLGSDTVCPDAVETDIVSIAVTKQIDESVVELDCCIRLSSSDDIIGTIKLYRDGAVIDSAAYDCRPNGSVHKTLLPFVSVDDATLAGSNTYKITFTRVGGASAVSCLAGTIIRPREFLR